MDLHGLTVKGLTEASEQLDRIRSGELQQFSVDEFLDPRLSYSLGPELPPVDPAKVQTRWHLALWLYVGLNDHRQLLTPPVWSWLAVYLFDIICPVSPAGRVVRESARYLLQADDYRKAYRHLLAGPYLLFAAHADEPSAVRGLLATKLDAPGEVYEQLASRKFLITSRAVAQTATRLYFDSVTGGLRRGAGGSGPGSPRRLGEVLQQFDRTYDLQTISAESLQSILPAEFDRFLKKG